MAGPSKKKKYFIELRKVAVLPNDLSLAEFEEKVKSPEYVGQLYKGIQESPFLDKEDKDFLTSEAGFKEFTGYGGSKQEIETAVKNVEPGVLINTPPVKPTTQPSITKPAFSSYGIESPAIGTGTPIVPPADVPALFKQGEQSIDEEVRRRYPLQSKFGTLPMSGELKVSKRDIPMSGQLFTVSPQAQTAFGDVNKMQRDLISQIKDASQTGQTFFEKGEMQRAQPMEGNQVSKRNELIAKYEGLSKVKDRMLQDASYEIYKTYSGKQPEQLTREILGELAITEGKNLLPNYESQAIIDELQQKKREAQGNPEALAEYNTLQQQAYANVVPEKYAFTNSEGNRIDLTKPVEAVKQRYESTDREKLKSLLAKKYADLQAYKALLVPERKGGEVVETTIGSHDQLFAGDVEYKKLYSEVLGIADLLAYNKNLFEAVQADWKKPEGLTGMEGLVWEAKKKINLLNEAMANGSQSTALLSSLVDSRTPKEERAFGASSAMTEDKDLGMKEGDMKALEAVAPTFMDNLTTTLGYSLPVMGETAVALPFAKGVNATMAKMPMMKYVLRNIDESFKNPKVAEYVRTLLADVATTAAVYDATGQGAATGVGEAGFGAVAEATGKKLPLISVFGRTLIGRTAGRLIAKTGEEFIEEKIGDKANQIYNEAVGLTDIQTDYEKVMNESLSDSEQDAILLAQSMLMALPGTFWQTYGAIKRYGNKGNKDTASDSGGALPEPVIEKRKDAVEAVNEALKAKVAGTTGVAFEDIVVEATPSDAVRIAKDLDKIRESADYENPALGDDFLTVASPEAEAGVQELNLLLDGFAQGNMGTSEDVSKGLAVVDKLISDVPAQYNMNGAQRASYLNFLDTVRLDIMEVQNQQLKGVVMAMPPTETVSTEVTDEVVPAEAVPAEAVPTEAVPTEAVPAEVVPAEAVPAEAVPAEAVPAEAVPAEAVPAEVAPTEAVPTEAVPTEVAPAETVPMEEVSTESVPVEQSAEDVEGKGEVSTVKTKEKEEVNDSNWREKYKEADAFRKSDILRDIAEVSKSDKELSDVLDMLVNGAPNESNVAWDVANNPNSSKETFERAVSNRALRKSTTDENIQSLREKRFGKVNTKEEGEGNGVGGDVEAEKLQEEKDTLLVDGIKNVSKNKQASDLLKIAMYRGVIPERLYNNFGKELAAIKVTPKSKIAVEKVAEVISKYIDAKNENVDDYIKEQNRAIENADFEKRAYGGMSEQEKFESIIEDKAAFSDKLNSEELNYVNENYFRPKGYKFNENWDLVKDETSENQSEPTKTGIEPTSEEQTTPTGAKPANQQNGGGFPTASSRPITNPTPEQAKALTVLKAVSTTLKKLFSNVHVLTGADWNQAVLAATQQMKLNAKEVVSLYNKSGDVTGFVFGNTVYLNGDVLTGKTVITEFSHVFLAHIKNKFPDVYKAGIDLVKKSPYFEKIKRSAFYKMQVKKLGLTGQVAEDFLAEEALTEAIADSGNSIAKETDGSPSALKQFVDSLWKMIKEFLGINNWQDISKLQNLTLEEYAQVIANTMLSGEEIEGEEVNIGTPLFQVTQDVTDEERFGIDYTKNFDADIKGLTAPLTNQNGVLVGFTPELQNALSGKLDADPAIANQELEFVNNMAQALSNKIAGGLPASEAVVLQMNESAIEFLTLFPDAPTAKFYALISPIGDAYKKAITPTVQTRVGGNGKVGTVVTEIFDAIRKNQSAIKDVKAQRALATLETGKAFSKKNKSNKILATVAKYSKRAFLSSGAIAKKISTVGSKILSEEVSALSDLYDFFGGRYINKVMPYLDKQITRTFPNLIGRTQSMFASMAANGNLAMRAIERVAASVAYGISKAQDQIAQAEYKNGLIRVGQAVSNNLVDLLNAVLYDPTLTFPAVPGYTEEEMRQIAIKQSRARVYLALNPSILQKLTFDEFDSLASKRIPRWSTYTAAFKQQKYAEYVATIENQAKSLGITYPAGSNTPAFGVSDLTPKEQEAMKIVRNVMDLVHDISFIVDGIGFGTYIDNLNNYMPRIIELKEENKNNADYEKFMRGVPENSGMVMGIYNKRQEDIDSFIQLNTVVDAAMSAKIRLQQVFRNKAVYDFAEFIVMQVPEMVSATKKPGYVKMPGSGFGLLNNKYVAMPVADDLRGFMFFTDSNRTWFSKTLNKLGNAFEWYDNTKLRQYLRLKNTVLNPRVAVANYTTGYTMASFIGISPLTQMKWFSKLFSDGKENLLTSDLYARLVAKGLLGTSSNYVDFFKKGEERLTLAKDEAILEAYRAGVLGEEAISELLKSALTNNVLSEAYAMTDEYHKVAAYLGLLELGMSEDIAIETVKRAFQNMERVAPLFARLAKTPGLNMFFRWAYQSKAILANGLANHPLTTVATMAALYAVPDLLSNLLGEDDDRREIREGKGSSMNFFGIKIPGQWSYKVGDIQKQIDVGRYLFPDRLYETGYENNDFFSSTLQSMDPTGFAKLGYFDGLTNLGEDTPESVLTRVDRPSPISDDKFFKWLNVASKDPVINLIIQTSFGMDFNNRDLVGSEVMDKYGIRKINTNSIGAEVLPRMGHLFRQAIPFSADAQDIVSALNGSPDYYNRWKTPTDAVLGLVGLKIETVNDQTLQAQTERIYGKWASAFVSLGKQANAEVREAEKAFENVRNIRTLMETNKDMTKEEMEAKIDKKIERDISNYEDALEKAQILRAQQIVVFEAMQNTHQALERLKWYETIEEVLQSNHIKGDIGTEVERAKKALEILERAEGEIEAQEKRAKQVAKEALLNRR